MSEGIQSGSPWVGGPVPIIGDNWVQFAGPSSPKITFDELSPAQQEVIVQYLFSMQTPLLIPPTAFNGNESLGSIAAARAALSLSNTQHEVVTQILDKWLESIKELDRERVKKDERHRAENIDNQHHFASLSAMNRLFHSGTDYDHDPNFQAFTLGLIITGMGVTEALLPSPNGQIAVNPVQDIANKSIAQIAPDLTMAIPVFCMCVIYNTVVQNVSAAEKSAPPKDLDFAKKYAQQMLNLIGSPQFENFLKALIISQTAKGEPLSDKRLNQLMAAVKTVLLATALAMVYIAEAGKMTSIEFNQMLEKARKGDMPFPEGDVRNALLAKINDNLDQMSPQDRETILAGLAEFFDGNPSVELLSNPTKVFGRINIPIPRGSLQA